MFGTICCPEAINKFIHVLICWVFLQFEDCLESESFAPLAQLYFTSSERCLTVHSAEFYGNFSSFSISSLESINNVHMDTVL